MLVSISVSTSKSVGTTEARLEEQPTESGRVAIPTPSSIDRVIDQSLSFVSGTAQGKAKRVRDNLLQGATRKKDLTPREKLLYEKILSLKRIIKYKDSVIKKKNLELASCKEQVRNIE